jgi:tetratricopeptide (TPR) repeat protein/predicted Ser/Thr protein kinase
MTIDPKGPPQLTCDDQRRRWGQGDRVRVESLMAEDPSLATDDERLLDLIYSEVLLRQMSGDPPRLEEYLQRFARLHEPIRQLFEVHEALEDKPSTHIVSAGPFVPLSEDLSAPVSAPQRRLPAVPGYEVLSELGRGGMGVVYKARHLALKRLVALKMLHVDGASEHALARFRTEAELIARLQHPNIVAIYEIGEQEGRPFFSMEYVEGGSLTARVAGSPQPADAAARLVLALARAGHFAHSMGVIHRDLKPANILLAKDGTPKITDFGLAKHLDAPDSRTRAGDLLGTPSYMAPEQAGGRAKEVGPVTDVYALGGLLYELLTGRPPFKGETATDTLLQVLQDPPVPPSRLRGKMPRDLETICLKCLEKEPRHRYTTAADLADDLERFLDGRSIHARPSPLWERLLKWGRRRPAAAGLLLVSILAVLVLLLTAWWYTRSEQMRLAHARDEINQTLTRGRDACLAGDWATARPHLVNVLDRLDAEPALADLRPEADRLLAETDHRLHTQETARHADQAYREFVRLRDAALFHGMNSLSGNLLLTGMEPRAHRRAVEESARQALLLAGVDLRGGRPWMPDPALASAERQEEVAEGCCALLLILADAIAEDESIPAPERFRQALHLVERAGDVHTPTVAFHRRRAHYRTKLGLPAEKVTGSTPSGALDYFLIGHQHLQQGELASARRAFDMALVLRPDHFWARFHLAMCHLYQREWDQAKSALGACLAQRSDFVWLYLMHSWASGELQDWKAAEEGHARAERLLAQVPNDEALYTLYSNRGLLRCLQGRIDEAEADLRQAIKLKPDRFPARVNLARAYVRQRQWAQAKREIDEAVRCGAPGLVLADFHAEHARDLLRTHDLTGAAEACREALVHASHHLEARALLGQVLFEQGRYQEAVVAYDRYLSQGGRPLADVYQGRGEARMRLGEFLGAVDDYTQALNLAPSAVLFEQRGWAYFFADAWRPALRDFDEAIHRDARRAGPFAGRGLCRVQLGDYRKAVEDADQALRLRPNNPEMLHNIACVFSLAVGCVQADTKAADRTALAGEWRARTVAVLRQALELVPTKERPSFWREKVSPDPALGPVRKSPEFQQLCQEVATPASRK